MDGRSGKVKYRIHPLVKIIRTEYRLYDIALTAHLSDRICHICFSSFTAAVNLSLCPFFVFMVAVYVSGMIFYFYYNNVSFAEHQQIYLTSVFLVPYRYVCKYGILVSELLYCFHERFFALKTGKQYVISFCYSEIQCRRNSHYHYERIAQYNIWIQRKAYIDHQKYDRQHAKYYLKNKQNRNFFEIVVAVLIYIGQKTTSLKLLILYRNLTFKSTNYRLPLEKNRI